MTEKELIQYSEWLSKNYANFGDHCLDKIAKEYIGLTKVHKDMSLMMKFDEFWKNESTKRWLSSKADAEEKFFKACKIINPDVLIHAKSVYFKYLSNCSYDRQTVGASVFLNVKTRYWEGDWEALLNEELRKKGIAIKPVGEVKKVDINKLFSE